MKFFKVKSYAKINLSLNITGKLESNFHKIESIFSFINLHDSIYLRKINTNNHIITFRGKFAKGISKKNTIFNLLQILDQKKILKNQKFEIKIIKNIPQKSGMGGGSMNAASLINFFLKKKILGANKKNIIKIAKIIGSDVVFGIDRRNSVLSSNGKFSKFNKKLDYYTLIVKPNFGCSTKLIYSKVKQFSKSEYNNPKVSLLSNDNIINSKNELENIAFKMYPKLKKIKLFLSKLSNVIFIRMTGSGSTIVAYFNSREATNIAAKEFKKKYKNYWCIKSKTI